MTSKVATGCYQCTTRAAANCCRVAELGMCRGVCRADTHYRTVGAREATAHCCSARARGQGHECVCVTAHKGRAERTSVRPAPHSPRPDGQVGMGQGGTVLVTEIQEKEKNVPPDLSLGDKGAGMEPLTTTFPARQRFHVQQSHGRSGPSGIRVSSRDRREMSLHLEANDTKAIYLG